MAPCVEPENTRKRKIDYRSSVHPMKRRSCPDPDLISTCPVLPDILSFLPYPELMKCLRVSSKLNNTVLNNWSRMQKQESYLSICMSIGHLVVNVNEIHDETSLHNYSFNIYENKIAGNIPIYLRSFLAASVQFDVVTKSRHYLVPSMEEGLRMILSPLLKRLRIRRTRMNVGSNLELLNIVRISLLENYRPHFHEIDVELDTSECHPMHSDLAKAFGATKYILYMDGHEKQTLHKMNTCSLPATIYSYNWCSKEILELIQEWKTGSREIGVLQSAGTETSFCLRIWNQVINDLRKKSGSWREFQTLSDIHFRIGRYTDSKVLNVTLAQSSEEYQIRFEVL